MRGEDAAPVQAWPRLARVQEQHLLKTLAQHPAVLITGPAGTGKTALALAATANIKSRLIVYGLAELSDVPLAALAPQLTRLGLPVTAEHAIPALLSLIGASPEKWIIVADDAAYLDRASAAAVYQLVRAFGVRCVLTARDRTLSAPLNRLDEEGMLISQPLAPFTPEEVAETLAQRFGGSVRHRDVIAAYTRTGGNPLHLRILATEVAADAVVVDELVEVPIARRGRGLSASVAAYVAGLDRADRELLETIALAQPVPLHLVTSTATNPQGVERLRRRLMVLVSGSPAVISITHPLVAEEAAATRSPAPIAARLRALGRPRDRFVAARLERHTDPHIDELLWAAGFAASYGDSETVLELTEIALVELLHHSQHPASFRTHLLRAVALSNENRVQEADVAFVRAAPLATSADEHEMLAIRHGDHLVYRRFDPTAALALASDTRSQHATTALGEHVAVWEAIADHHEGGTVVTSNSASVDPEIAVLGAMAAVMTASMSGALDEARASARILEEIERRHGELDPLHAALAGLERYFGLLASGRAEAAAKFVQNQRAASAATPAIGVWTYTLGIHRLYNGRLAEAATLSALASDQLRWRDGLGLLAASRALEATIAAQYRRTCDAEAIIDSMAPAQRSEPKAALLLAEASAWQAVWNGDRHAAVAILIDAASTAAALEFRLVGALTIAQSLRLGGATAAQPLVERILEGIVEPPALYRAVRDLTNALVSNDSDAAAHACRAIARCGMHTVAVDAAALARRATDNAESRRRLDLVIADYSREVDAPSWQTSPSGLLSAREWEVARSASRRERNREIADKLGISVRTVENQLASIYRKLGIHSRDDLREALAEL
ncbi:LuxR C-terminal-related transcriptional regulator (plasmid) [Coraliomargarita sp. W4R53]